MATIGAGLELRTQRPVLSQSIRVRMTVTNDSNQVARIVNPDVGTPAPDLKWSASLDAYRIGVLSSVGLIEMTLHGAGGVPVESRNWMPWVTPLVGTRELPPRANVTFEFDVNELFRMTTPGRYDLHVRYGAPGASGDAALAIDVAENRA